MQRLRIVASASALVNGEVGIRASSSSSRSLTRLFSSITALYASHPSYAYEEVYDYEYDYDHFYDGDKPYAARAALDCLLDMNISPFPHLVQILLMGLAMAEHYETVVSLHRRLGNNSRLLGNLIHCISRLRWRVNLFGPSAAVVAKIVKLGFQSDSVTYVTLNHGFLFEHKNVSGAVLDEIWGDSHISETGLFQRMADHRHVNADAMDGLITIQHAVAGAGVLLKLMHTSNRVLVDGLCQTGQSSVAAGWLLRMLEVGYYPDLLNYAKVVESLCDDFKVDEALDLVSKLIRGKGLVPASFTCNCLIRALCNDGQSDRALDFVDELLALGIYPDEYAYAFLLDALLKEGWSSLASELVLTRRQYLISALLNNGYKPDSCTYTNLIDGYCKTGMIDEAAQLLDAMSRIGLVPDNVVRNSILGGLLQSRILADTKHLSSHRNGNGSDTDIDRDDR
ncbi:hypothetical protein Tsubulata_051315 [Turnera subulata]|uniref:Pentacotripeptide-repeat region of PRORP domain-containing protein n=1 Tax=Turnera subulata TaxID=218843 RepID=A0A9Q0JII6_9ROSI|nr:hypothetical protein Tsubulata_051315 [Turnera subulata]